LKIIIALILCQEHDEMLLVLREVQSTFLVQNWFSTDISKHQWY